MFLVFIESWSVGAACSVSSPADFLAQLRRFFNAVFDGRYRRELDAGDVVCLCLLIGFIAPAVLCVAAVSAVVEA